MKRYGIISYNIYCNFTNYGSALQSWALHQVIKKFGKFTPILVDYCPDVLLDMDPLHPYKNMWDQDEKSRYLCELTIPAIRLNYKKFDEFYKKNFTISKKKYTSSNFNKVVVDEALDGFVCGSDTIFCPDEFGFDDGFYANYECMKGKTVAYAASFGDLTLSDYNCKKIDERLSNFKAIGLREKHMIEYVSGRVSCPVAKVLDPTLLLDVKDYNEIVDDRVEYEKYLLLYSRRYSYEMEQFAEKIAKKNGWKIIEISLRATNAEKGHRMFYEAGIEEFLSLIKYAEFVVTNSFHGVIFSVQFEKEFVVFNREQCDIKVRELLDLFGIPYRRINNIEDFRGDKINYRGVQKRIKEAREYSLQFLEMELSDYLG